MNDKVIELIEIYSLRPQERSSDIWSSTFGHSNREWGGKENIFFPAGKTAAFPTGVALFLKARM